MTISTHRGRVDWYDIIIFALAGAIVYPDKILEWLSDKTGKVFGWWHLIFLELVAIGSLIVVMLLLLPSYPKLDWWEPVLFVGLLAAIRIGVWVAMQIFGLDD